MTSFSERFVRAENIKHYRDLLARTTDTVERKKIQMLLDEEQQRQTDAGDFDLKHAS